jgi:hypothetical protein
MNRLHAIGIMLFIGLSLDGSSMSMAQSAIEISSGWLMQDVMHVKQSGEAI